MKKFVLIVELSMIMNMYIMYLLKIMKQSYFIKNLFTKEKNTYIINVFFIKNSTERK